MSRINIRKNWHKALLLFLGLEIVFIADLFTPVSIAGLYLIAIIITFNELSYIFSIFYALISLIMVIIAGVIRPLDADLIINETLITSFSFICIIYILSTKKQREIELIENKNELNKALFKIKSNKNEVMKSYIKAIESKDIYTRGHSENVANYALEIAKQIGFNNEEELNFIYEAAFLHDLGKICIEKTILHKSGPLEKHEIEEIKKHSIIGFQILSQIPCLRAYALAIRHHHERYDGEGYPDGLSKTQIPLPSRIIAVADAFDAMTSERPYRKAMTIEKAVQELEFNKEKQFDPHIVDAFIRVLENRGKIKKRRIPLFEGENIHSIFFYDNFSSLKKTANNIIADSLTRNRKVIACFDETIRNILKGKYKKEFLKGQLLLQSSKEYNWYGNNIPESMIYNLNQMCNELLNDGYEGLTIIGDGNYISQEIGFKNLLEAEKYINEALDSLPVFILCLYKKETKYDDRIDCLINSHTHKFEYDKLIKIN